VAFNPPDLNNKEYRSITWIIDFLFGLDVLLSFRTTMVDEISKVEIYDARLIAKRYILRGRFLVDVISSIPFEAIIDSHSDKLKLISILKLARIFRFTRIISFLNASEDLRLSLKLFKLIFYLVIYLHLQACAWFFYTNLDKQWFPLTDII
jgi:heme/copper-type cytochrome/quinol oxidase subunit 4